MRNALAAEIVALAQEDSHIVLLSGDIGNRLFNGFKERFPDRFFNCGVAEANMTSMAGGRAGCAVSEHPTALFTDQEIRKMPVKWSA